MIEAVLGALVAGGLTLGGVWVGAALQSGRFFPRRVYTAQQTRTAVSPGEVARHRAEAASVVAAPDLSRYERGDIPLVESGVPRWEPSKKDIQAAERAMAEGGGSGFQL